MPQEVGMKELLEAGLHFGHQTRRWNPRMRRFIFGEREGIHVIDLQQTQVLLDRATRLRRRGGPRRWCRALRRHQEAGERLGQGVGREERHALREPALARRPADELRDDLEADRSPARADEPQGERPARPAADQGADVDGGRAQEARVQPRRRPRHEAAAAGRLHRRPEDRGDRGARGPAPRDPDDRPGRLQRRPGPGRSTRSRATTTRSAPAIWSISTIGWPSRTPRASSARPRSSARPKRRRSAARPRSRSAAKTRSASAARKS